jgi:hypothetical protein
MRDEVYGINKALYTKEPPIPINKLRPNQASPTSSAFPRAHLRNGSAHLVGNDNTSPAASPSTSPVRTTHDILHSATSTSHNPYNEGTSYSTTSIAAGGLSHSSSVRRRANNFFGTSNAAHHNGLLRIDNNSSEHLPISPNLGGTSPLPTSSSSNNNTSVGLTIAEPPTPTASSYLQSTSSNDNDRSQAVEGLQSAAMTHSSRLPVDGAIQIPPPASTSTSSSSSLHSQRPATAQAMSTSPGGTSLVLPNRPSTAAESPSFSSTASMTPASGSSEKRNASASSGAVSGSSADNPYKSFRVTLEDPCYKVLPAALKKYKINDDWRQYALFICYGNQGKYSLVYSFPPSYDVC